LICNN